MPIGTTFFLAISPEKSNVGLRHKLMIINRFHKRECQFGTDEDITGADEIAQPVQREATLRSWGASCMLTDVGGHRLLGEGPMPTGPQSVGVCY